MDTADEIMKLVTDAGYKTERLDSASLRDGPAWGCKIGLKKGTKINLPGGADGPMRDAVKEAFKKITGIEADFCFSGWGAKMTLAESDEIGD